MVLPTDLTPNSIMYFQRLADVCFPTASLRDGYLHNTSRDKILLFLNKLQKLLACHRGGMKGWGQQVSNKTKSLFGRVLRAETHLRADESCVAARHVSATGLLSTGPGKGDRAGTGSVGH